MGKHKRLQKLTALILFIAMLTGIPSGAAAAQDLPTEASPAFNEAGPASLGMQPDLLGSGAASFILKNLAAGALTSLGEYGMDQALEAIFGSQTGEAILAFEEIKDEIRGLKAQIENLSAKLDLVSLKNDLNTYAVFMNNYSGVYEKFCISRDYYAKDAKQTKLFLTNLYSVKDLNYLVEGKSVINATLALGNRLTMPFAGNYNVFGAFDKLDRFIHRWEHQGYAQRKSFRDSAVYTYALFSSMSQLACQTIIDSNPGNDENSRNLRLEAAGWLQLLKENAVKVNEMNERCSVIEHPGLRIYRDTKKGIDLYVFYKEVKKSYMYTEKNPEWKWYTSKWSSFYSEKLIFPMAQTSKFNIYDDGPHSTRYHSQQPAITMYQVIYKDYQADNGGKPIDLHDIFFGANNGAFTRPDGVPAKASFATHIYRWQESPYRAPRCTWTATVVNHQAQTQSLTLVDAQFHPNYDLYTINSHLDASFYSPIYYYGTVEQGKLMLPPEEEPVPEPADRISGMAGFYELPYAGTVTLSVEEKVGYTCQWHVNTGNGSVYEAIYGETGTNYNLPPLTPTMNGYQYACTFVKGDGAAEDPPGDPWSDYSYTAPVTLRLVGEGESVLEAVHEVSNAAELEAALEQVSAGEWNGHTLKLTSDIRYPLPLTLLDRSLTLDLNGCRLIVAPAATAAPNIDPLGSAPAVAAIYAGSNSSLTVIGGEVAAGQGVAYGIYATEESSVQAGSVTSEGGADDVPGAAAIRVSEGGQAVITGDLQANGQQALGASADGGSISINGNMTIAGAGSAAAYIASSNGTDSGIAVGGNITVTGAGSRAAYLDTEKAALMVAGSIRVTEGSGVAAGQGRVTIHGGITVQSYAVNAWNGAAVYVGGNILATGKETAALSAAGASLQISGNVTASGQGGTGIKAAAWELSEPALGTRATVDGRISAPTPLRIGSLPVTENQHGDLSAKPGYYAFSDGINTLWAKPGSFVVLTGDSSDEGNGNGGGSSTGGGTPATGSGETNPDRPVTAVVPVTAQAAASGMDGANGMAGAAIPDQAVSEAIARAQAEAESQGKAAAGIALALNIAMPAEASSLTATLSQSALNNLINSGARSLAINGGPVSLSLDLKALEEIRRQSEGDISIVITPAAGLSSQAQALIGNRPVYSITINSIAGGQSIDVSSLGGGQAALAIPYVPAANEAVAYLFGVYVNDNGNAAPIPGSAYDPSSRAILIPTGHFSIYGAGYTAPAARFTDIGGHWAKASIDYAVGRGLLAGTSGATFSPDLPMTRGMLATVLGRLAQVDTSLYTGGSFTDVQEGNAFRPYIEWAAAKSIIQDAGNGRFAPDRSLSREEMALILQNFARAAGYQLPLLHQPLPYADKDSIGNIYQDAVQAMQQAGVMTGQAAGNFNPKAQVTRAEVTAILHRYIKLTVDSATAQGWTLKDDGRYFYYKDGKALTGIQAIDGVKYFFEAEGGLKTGWVKDDTGKWLFYDINKLSQLIHASYLLPS